MTRLPPKMHPEDRSALSTRLETIGTRIQEQLDEELERRTRYLRAELEKLEMRTRSRGVLVPLSTHEALEARVVELEKENRDILRSLLRAHLSAQDITDRAEALVQELREELTG